MRRILTVAALAAAMGGCGSSPEKEKISKSDRQQIASQYYDGLRIDYYGKDGYSREELIHGNAVRAVVNFCANDGTYKIRFGEEFPDGSPYVLDSAQNAPPKTVHSPIATLACADLKILPLELTPLFLQSS